ncbi:POT family MFS transporter [Arenicella sp.]|nr:POT family MFS transporter [Arenicella sp.]
MPKYRTAPLRIATMPPGIPNIVGNEAAERFSFYGMRGILVAFMIGYLHLMGEVLGEEMTDAAARERFHAFVKWVYFFPIIGAFLSDAFLGKYWTIISLSIVYCIGHLCLALMGTVGSPELMMNLGLILIAIGSGGIKPCVTAHVGDQFGKTNAHLLTKIFNYFYFSINVGAFIAHLFTPWLLKWYGPHWAFGVPGVLMALATLFFWMGRKKFAHVPAAGFSGLVTDIVRNRGWVAMLKLSIIYLFVAAFWALFDQTGSSWILQAGDMNRKFLGLDWLPSQIQSLNPLLVLIFIPVFTQFVYPAIGKVFEPTPLRKICLGLFLMAAAFALVSVVQQQIDAGARPSIGWQFLAYILLTAAEIMVSIVALEFSYTQAPNSMKSVIMGLFLLSVSLGNYFTESVNHFIQVPNTLVPATGKFMELDEKEREKGMPVIRLAGFDGKENTEDDILVTFKEGSRHRVDFQGVEVIEEAVTRIDGFVEGNENQVPDPEKAKELLVGLKDPWGNELVYTRVNRLTARITSMGPDKKWMTEWDQGGTVELSLKKDEEEEKNWFHKLTTPEESWLEMRKRELGAGEKDEDGSGNNFFVGGQTKLEGAAYFWFFTALMGGTSVLFLFVVKFYRPKEFLQEEVPEEQAEDEALAH